MPLYYAMGLSKQEVLESNPAELEYVFEAQKIKTRMQDENDWRSGMYVHSALICALDSCFNGKKAQSKYPDEPMLKHAIMDEKDKIKEADVFWEQLHTMQKNFEISKGKGEIDGNN